MTSLRNWYSGLLIVGVCLAFVAIAESSPPMASRNGYFNNDLEELPEDLLLELIGQYDRTMFQNRQDSSNAKRTVDFGLGRGYSGIQEAKHRIGLAAANYAGGPGRRRRSLGDDDE